MTLQLTRQLATCDLDLFIRREMAELTVTLVKKKDAKSVVWCDFGLTADEKGVPVPGEEHRPVCRMCKKAVMCKGVNTTNLFVHLRDAHPNLHKEATQGKTNTSKGKEPAATQPTLTAIIEKGKQYDPKSLLVKELDHMVVYYIAKDMQPYSSVKSPGFTAIVSKLNP